jgi:hypothetical protein
MTKLPSPFELITTEEYHESTEERLAKPDISERSFYTFMGIARGMAEQAFTAIVTAELMRTPRDTLTYAKLSFKDSQDLRSIMLLGFHFEDGFLVPLERGMVKFGRGFGKSTLAEAYLLGYDDGVDDPLEKEDVDNDEDVPVLTDKEFENVKDVFSAFR